jgi:protein-disulfide isomerase
MRLAFAASLLAFTTAFSGSALAQAQSSPVLSDMSEADRAALRTEIRAYLLENPEVLMEAIQILEARRAEDARRNDSELIAAHRGPLFDDPGSWVGGNPDGDVTLVEFADYQCGYCKRAHPELKELLERDTNVRFIVKEFPVLGPNSVTAARIATAALDIDPSKYGALHDALMTFEGTLSEDTAYQIAAHVGYDVSKLKERAGSADIEARIADNYALANAMGLRGTPSFVLSDRIIRGYVPLDELLAAVEEVRTAQK